uniref:uncharacterized protein LOC120347998 n=1 Tax=Styela clava TaxID=7725 RepID=UPI001939461F|nr:uncharacterized protein LOC120347998 [Styela clava]
MSLNNHKDGKRIKPEKANRLLEIAYKAIQDDVHSMLQENNAMLEKSLQKAASDAKEKLDSAMRVVKANLEYLHKENLDQKKKIQELEDIIKTMQTERDELTEKLKEEAKQGTKDETETGDQPGTSNSCEPNISKDGLKINFEKEVSGKNTMIACEVAAVSEGGDMRFLEALDTNDTRAMINKNAEIPDMENGNSNTEGSVNVTGIEGTFAGCGNVNVQKNEQNIFLPGDKRNIEVDENGEPVEYSRADQNELSEYLDRVRDEAAQDGNAGEAVELSPDEKQQKGLIRVANIYKKEGTSKNFIQLCELLVNMTPAQLRSLGPHFQHITQIDLSNIQMNYALMANFFRCFEKKRFQWLLLRYSLLEYLDMSHCSFDSTAFINMAPLISHVDNLIVKSLTMARIIAKESVTTFSAEDAGQLAESILDCDQTLSLDMSYSYFEDGVIKAFSDCLPKLSKFSLRFGKLSTNGLKMALEKVVKMQKLDLTGVALGNVGVRIMSEHLHKFNILVLSNVMLDDEGVQPLMDAVEKLPENSLKILDISLNPINTANISRFLKTLGNLKLLMFFASQMEYQKHKEVVDEEKILLSEVINGKIKRLDESNDNLNATIFTHWIACVKPVDNIIKKYVAELIRLYEEEKHGMQDSEFRCSKCKTHIAFKMDSIQNPCAFLHQDRKMLGLLESSSFTAVSHATSCVPDSNSNKKHHCSTPNCQVRGYKFHKCRCVNCKQNIGGYYDHKNGGKFWCLYQESQNSSEVGSSKAACRQM